MVKNLIPAIPGNDAFSYRLNHACDIDSQDVGISPPLISLGGHLIVDRIEARGATLTRASSTPGRGIDISPIRKLEGGPGLSRRTAFMKFEPISLSQISMSLGARTLVSTGFTEIASMRTSVGAGQGSRYVERGSAVQ